MKKTEVTRLMNNTDKAVANARRDEREKAAAILLSNAKGWDRNRSGLKKKNFCKNTRTWNHYEVNVLVRERVAAELRYMAMQINPTEWSE